MTLRLKFILVVGFGVLLVIATWTALAESAARQSLVAQAQNRMRVVQQFATAREEFLKSVLGSSVLDEFARQVTASGHAHFMHESLSSSFAMRPVFEKFNQAVPAFRYSQPSLNPLNDDNPADRGVLWAGLCLLASLGVCHVVFH